MKATLTEKIDKLTNNSLRKLLFELAEIGLNRPANMNKASKNMKNLWETIGTDYFEFWDKYREIKAGVHAEIVNRFKAKQIN